LFLIPGNHDIDRNVETPCWKKLRHAFVNCPDTLQAARWISGGPPPPGFQTDWRERVSLRLANYRHWVAKELGRPDLTGTENLLGYRASLTLPDIDYPIHILGLNTAWLCGDDNDSGKLWILDEQLMRIATDRDGLPLTGLRLLMMHHPFDQTADGAGCRRLLCNHVDLVFRGHLHEEEIETWSDPDQSVRQLAAGCLYEGSRGNQWPNACHVVTIDGRAGWPADAEIHFRSWSNRSGSWHPENGIYRGTRDGRLQFKLGKREPDAGNQSAKALRVDPWRPAVPPMFTGRATLLNRLFTSWDMGRSVSLVGDWRIGKSSILATCYQSLEKAGRPVRLVDGESNAGQSPGAFVKAATGLAASEDSDGAANVLAEWARRAGQSGMRPLLLVDECDAVVHRFDYRFFERIRGMLDYLCIGVSSRRELDRVFQDAGQGGSPFQNALEMHWVGLLEPQGAEELIASCATAVPHARSMIREWAGRHPFFIQLLSLKLAEARRYGQSESWAHEEFLTEASARLRELWNTLSERDRQLLAEAGNFPAPQARGLRRRGLLDEEGRHFGKVLTDWIANEMPSDSKQGR
jgi:hypothetical protein